MPRRVVALVLFCLLFAPFRSDPGAQGSAPSPPAAPPALRPPTRADALRGEYGRYRANNDLLSYRLDIRVDPERRFLAGTNTVRFKMLSDDTRIQLDLYQNLAIATNVIHGSHVFGVRKLLNLGSSCIYPRLASQPIHESELLTGPLEPTNRPYAVAKIAAIEMCDAYRRQYGCNFISAMPTNVYGPGDNFDLETSHVVPALIRKFLEAKRVGADVVLWGSGSVRREFIYVDDLADACLFLMENFSEPGPINVGRVAH